MPSCPNPFQGRSFDSSAATTIPADTPATPAVPQLYGLDRADDHDRPLWVLVEGDRAGVDRLFAAGVQAACLLGPAAALEDVDLSALADFDARYVVRAPGTPDAARRWGDILGVLRDAGVFARGSAYLYGAKGAIDDPVAHFVDGGVVDTTGGPLFVDDVDDVDDAPTWAPLDLGPILDGSLPEVRPTFMARTDGRCLLYPGLTHSFHGESESFKSGLAQYAVTCVLGDGGRAVYVDHESDAASVVKRLLAMGAEPSVLGDPARFVYVRPAASPAASREREAYETLLSGRADIVVIDGVTDAMATAGIKSVDSDEVSTWVRYVPRRIADRTGAAVVMIDHVTKSHDGRGRFAIGSQQKMNALTGAAYTIEIVEPCGIGMVGRVSLRLGKDRPGTLRPIAGEFRAGDRTQEIATAIVDAKSAPGRTLVRLEPPEQAAATGEVARGPWRPTKLMARVSTWAEQHADEALSKTAIADACRGRRADVLRAVDLLIEGGFLDKETSNGGRNVHYRHRRRYIEAHDPGAAEFADPVFGVPAQVRPPVEAANPYSAAPRVSAV